MACPVLEPQLRSPILFLSHGGGPCFFLDGRDVPMFAGMDKHSKGADFFRGVSAQFGDRKPKAIVIISAHWEEEYFTVNAFKDGTELLYDYYGFPESSYAPHLTYPAKSSHELQERVLNLLRAEFGEIGASTSQTSRGFDHGVFIPLKLAFPSADVPVVQVSCRKDLDFSAHYQLGRALAPLANEEVWIIGSGSITHNLREITPGAAPVSWAVQFLEWLSSVLLSAHEDPVRAKDQLLRLMDIAPHAKRAHPRTEHLVPLLVAFGAAFPLGGEPHATHDVAKSVRASKIYHEIFAGTVSLDAFSFI